LIPYNDRKSLLKAIQINTFLWGGQYNPIVPIFTHPPRNLPKYLSKTIAKEEYLQHYLNNFDPDLIVLLGDCENQSFNTSNREIISFARILSEVETFRIPQFGIGLFEVLTHFASNEDKYVSRHRRKLLVPKFSRRYSLFLASVFGQLSDELGEIFSREYLPYFEHETASCEIDTYTDLLTPQNMFLRRFTAYQIKQGGYSLDCIFYLDANNFLDIVDYWNLRALGLNVLPIAKQAKEAQKIKGHALSFVNEHYKPTKYPATYHATVFHGYSSSYEESQGFIETLGVSAQAPVQEAKVGFSYLPPMGDWGFENYIKPVIRSPIVREASYSSAETTQMALQLISPEFVLYPGVPGQHRFANEIELRADHDKELRAEVIPEGHNLIALSLGGFDFTNWRFSKGRMIYLATFADHTLHINAPLAEDVFFRWFQNTKFKTSISQGGRIAKQVLKSLGGVGGIWLLADEKIFDMIQQLNYRRPRKSDSAEKNIDESKGMDYETLLGKIKKIANQSETRLHSQPNYLFKKLLDAQVLKLGIEVQCTFCNQPSWYSIDGISYKVQCVNCLEEFSLPTYSPKKDLTWSYRTIGAFSPAAQSYGSYAVLLALRFFAITLHGRTTPIFGLEIKTKDSDEKSREADLALFFRPNYTQIGSPDLVFVECKTYTEGFKQKDIDTMKQFAEHFPDAYFAFATLKKTLTPMENRLIKSFIGFLKKRHRTNNDQTKVLILTGIELYSDKGPPRCWEGQIESIPTSASNFSFTFKGLIGLCELTQEIHLS
jgi:hypothetical protein